MAIKRAVFARKQRAIQDALRIGDSIARQRNRELLEATFKAWHFQVRHALPPSPCCITLLVNRAATGRFLSCTSHYTQRWAEHIPSSTSLHNVCLLLIGSSQRFPVCLPAARLLVTHAPALLPAGRHLPPRGTPLPRHHGSQPDHVIHGVEVSGPQRDGIALGAG